MENSSNQVKALLGPTNTGKTFVAIEEMLKYESGIFGFPLRLLAREVYDKCVSRVGSSRVALIIGEEKIIPSNADYFICTVDSMPKDKSVDFVSRLERKSAIIAFSIEDVYAIAELIRRQKGGAAVIMGSLSPKTRNSQVELYQSGDVDYLVATDAIGMGLNMDINEIYFSNLKKFDGKKTRRLNLIEISQIAGRAGRFKNDGFFGTTGECEVLNSDEIENSVVKFQILRKRHMVNT